VLFLKLLDIYAGVETGLFFENIDVNVNVASLN
jgi:hypothetical protein